MTYVYPRYDYERPAEFSGDAVRHRVVVVGAGMVGLTLALDLARRGVKVVVLDDDDTVSEGSRAICLAKRTLEIFDRLGLGPRLLAKGVTWNVGKVFFQDRLIYSFNLQPEEGHEYPAFINLQQYYLEEWLVEACREAGVELRWRSRVSAVENHPDHVALTVTTPDGSYRLESEWLLACDGARSFVREAMGLPFIGKVFRDRFLIADVRMQAAFPNERWFWFDPPFHRGQSVLLHKQPDDIWRIDFQLGWGADPEEERRPERVIPRVRAMLGAHVPFELEWVSVYTFRCRRLERFVHGRTIFAGDAAHQVSPFGARGGNAGVQDADNLAWKLAAVLEGRAGPALIATYDEERIAAAEENILNSTRSTDFITPKTKAAQAYRDGVLGLAEHFPFARPLVNSGRLSRPAVLASSPLNVRRSPEWRDALPLGAPAADAPVRHGETESWLLHHCAGPGFTLLGFGAEARLVAESLTSLPVALVHVTPEAGPAAPGVTRLWDRDGLARSRYGTPPGGCVLLRPDQHVLARFARFDPEAIRAALAHAYAPRHASHREHVG